MKNGFSKQFAWAQLPPVGKLISSSAQKGTQHVCVPKKKRKKKRKAVETLLHLLPEHRRQHTDLQREPRLPHVWEFKLHWSLPTTPEYRCWWKTRSSTATWINSMKTESFGSWIKVYLILLPFDFHARLPLRRCRALYWKHLSLYPRVIWQLLPLIWFQRCIQTRSCN